MDEFIKVKNVRMMIENNDIVLYGIDIKTNIEIEIIRSNIYRKECFEKAFNRIDGSKSISVDLIKCLISYIEKQKKG